MPFIPSSEEKEKAQKILASLTLSSGIYEKYLKKVDLYTKEHEELFNAIPKNLRHRIEVREYQFKRSNLFEKDLFIAYAKDHWFIEKAPGCNAIASTDLRILDLMAPPLVLIPISQKGAQSTEFVSIVEHEFVHVGQGLLDRFPGAFCGKAQMLLKNFLTRIQVEYEANFIQFVNWPEVYPKEAQEAKLPLEEWCILRGYTQSLEQLLLGTARGEVLQSEAIKLLNFISENLPQYFEQMDLDISVGKHYAQKLPTMVWMAISVLCQVAPNLKKENFAFLFPWLSKRI